MELKDSIQAVEHASKTLTATKTGLAKARQAVDFAYEAMQSEMLRVGSSSDATTARTIRDAAADKGHALADKVHAKASAEALEDAKKDLE